MQNNSDKKSVRDVNQVARFFVRLVTGNPITEDISPIADKGKNPLPAKLSREKRRRSEKNRSK